MMISDELTVIKGVYQVSTLSTHHCSSQKRGSQFILITYCQCPCSHQTVIERFKSDLLELFPRQFVVTIQQSLVTSN